MTARTGSDRTSSAQAALGAAFAVVFVLWLFWGYGLVRSLQSTERDVESVQSVYASGEQALVRIRTNVLLGSIYLRDALIETAGPQRPDYRAKLEQLRRDTDQWRLEYRPFIRTDVEREQFDRLGVELEEYWMSRSIPFASGTTSPAQAAALLRTRIVPRRDSVLAILDQLGELHGAASQRRRRELELVYRSLGQRVLVVGSLTLVIALVVAVVAWRHVRRLQMEVERQRQSELLNRKDLERLSARLVDVQERERRSLARELHDAVGQALTAVKMDIGIALRAESGPRVRAALEEAREITETTLRGVRDLSQLLHPSTLDDFGLPATLTAYLRSFSQRTGIRAELMETLEQRLAPEVETCAYRIVQEALHNVARHSNASACTVWLSVVEGTLHLRIEDNGQGLPPRDREAPRGLGMIAMRERAQALGGSFALEGGEEGGTRVVVRLPLGARPEPAYEEPLVGTTVDELAG